MMGDKGIRLRRSAGLHGLALTVAAAWLVAAAAIAPPVPLAAASPTLEVGSQALHRCGSAWCGRLLVPLDWAYPSGPKISIAYRWYPASDTDAAPLGTLMPVEGGPGYPSIGSVELGQAGGYAAMYGPLMLRRNLLAVDLRGTGNSALIDCPTLQNWSGSTAGASFQSAAQQCAESVDRKYHTTPGGRFLASSVFSSAEAAADVAAVVDALRTGPVDVYGDSYGSFFAATFAARYPHLVRSVILDSTYQLRGLDPWYRSSIDSLRRDFVTACSRSLACTSTTSNGWTQVVALADYLKSHTAVGVVPDGSGHAQRVTMGEVGLVNLVNDAAEDPVVYRELDAAAASWLRFGDPDALLRLYAERFVYDENYFHTPASSYSGGLYIADSCIDYPQLFDLASSPADRKAQLQAAIANLAPNTFAPFSVNSWLDMDQNTENYTACLDWPSPLGATKPVTAPEPFLAKSVPLLILGGELDGWTPPSGLPAVVREMGGHSRVIVIANSTHVVGEGDRFGCATTLIRQFVASPGSIDRLDAACAPAVPAIHVVGLYPDSLAQQTPLAVSSGRNPGPIALRLAAAAVDTGGDSIVRYGATGNQSDAGLHGGTVVASHGGRTLELHDDQMIPGVEVSGTVRLSADGLSATAELKATSSSGAQITISATWNLYGQGALAQVSGRSDSVPFAGYTAAP